MKVERFRVLLIGEDTGSFLKALNFGRAAAAGCMIVSSTSEQGMSGRL
jgi:hypothetical protein